MSVPARVVGLRPAPDTLPRGVVTLLKACRAAGFFAWVTEGTVTKPVKVVAAKDSGDGKAVFEDRPFRRLLVKGRHRDGRRFVVQYLGDGGDGWKSETAYLLTRDHHGIAPGSLRSWTDTSTEEPGTPFSWVSERPSFDAATVTQVKAYVASGGPVPSTSSDDTKESRR